MQKKVLIDKVFLNTDAPFKIDEMVAGEIRFWKLGENWRPYLGCPRCGEVICFSDHEWKMVLDMITISPSIGHDACKAHFFVENSVIRWVSDL